MKETERRASVSGTILKMSILFIALQDNGQGAATPALGAIGEAFPLTSYQLISMVATIPALMEAVIPLFYPQFIKIVRKRSILIFCVVLYLVGGVGPALINSSIYIILFFRLLIGVGSGFFSVMCPDLVVDFFDGPARNTMMGLSGALTGLSGVLFQTLGGWLAGIHWTYCFYAYILSVVCLMVPVIFLPEPDRQSKLDREIEVLGKEKAKSKLPPGVWIMAAFLFMFWMLFYIIITNGSGLLISEGIASEGQIGLIFSCMTGGQVISSALLGALLKKSGYQVILPAGMVFGAIAMFLTSGAYTIPSVTAGLVCLGIAGGLITPGCLAKCTSLVPYAAGTKALSAALFLMNIGGFISPMIFGNLGLTAREQIRAAGIIFIVLAVLIFIASCVVKPKEDYTLPPEQQLNTGG